MKRVGRSFVSAITQTPASGPRALVTTPPRSLSPVLMPAGACALTGVGGAPSSAAIAIAATPKNRPVLMVMTGSSRLIFGNACRLSAGRLANIHAQTPALRNDTTDAPAHAGHEPRAPRLSRETRCLPVRGARYFVAFTAPSHIPS